MSKSVEELFKDAPNGATHYNFANQMFYRFCGGRGEVFHFSFMDWQDASALHEYGSLMIERPQPKPWSGPEDGLPPVGTTCEALNGLHDQWRTVLILDHEGSVPTAACRDEENRLWWSQEFRAIKTPEQLAAEKRESAIREFMDVVGIDCRVTASKAVDAGFKREVK